MRLLKLQREERNSPPTECTSLTPELSLRATVGGEVCSSVTKQVSNPGRWLLERSRASAPLTSTLRGPTGATGETAEPGTARSFCSAALQNEKKTIMDTELDKFDKHELDAVVRRNEDSRDACCKELADSVHRRQKFLATLRSKVQRLKEHEEQSGTGKMRFTGDYEDDLLIHADQQALDVGFDDWPVAKPCVQAIPTGMKIPDGDDDLPIARRKSLGHSTASSA
jgi:hypothetical protein